MIVLIVTNIILAVAIGFGGIALLGVMTRDSRPIVIKEAKALREYYEGKFKDMQKKTEEAKSKYDQYKELYENQLQRNRNMDGAIEQRDELEAQVERLSDELNSCEDRISEMAQENANLKEQIRALKNPAKKGEKCKKTRTGTTN